MRRTIEEDPPLCVSYYRGGSAVRWGVLFEGYILTTRTALMSYTYLTNILIDVPTVLLFTTTVDTVSSPSHTKTTARERNKSEVTLIYEIRNYCILAAHYDVLCTCVHHV